MISQKTKMFKGGGRRYLKNVFPISERKAA
jgi:hypothetical protein